MKSLLKSLVIILVILYPFIIFIGLQSLSVRYLGLFIILIFILRLIVMKSTLDMVWIFITIIGIALVCIAMLSGDVLSIQLYPGFISLILLGVFAYSLFQPLSLISRLAMKMSKEPLSDYAISYTWYVTLVWCLFFIFNTSVSLYTAVFGSLELWTLYNGFVSYILMGALFVVEFVIRFFVRKYYEKHS